MRSRIIGLREPNLLDISRGLAIMLVVLGHTFQGLLIDFDKLIGFRVIYSFHMPLFVLISGWAFCLTQSRVERLNLIYIIDRVRISFFHLIIPFLSWMFINFFYNFNNENLISFIFSVFKNIDRGLWYFICIFYCVSVTLVFSYIIDKLTIKCDNKNYKNLILFIFSLIIFYKLPGVYYGISFFKSLYLFFIIGYLIYFYRKFILKN